MICVKCKTNIYDAFYFNNRVDMYYAGNDKYRQKITSYAFCENCFVEMSKAITSWITAKQ